MLGNIGKLILNLYLYIVEEFADRLYGTVKREPVFNSGDTSTDETIDFD